MKIECTKTNPIELYKLQIMTSTFSRTVANKIKNKKRVTIFKTVVLTCIVSLRNTNKHQVLLPEDPRRTNTDEWGRWFSINIYLLAEVTDINSDDHWRSSHIMEDKSRQSTHKTRSTAFNKHMINVLHSRLNSAFTNTDRK